MTRTTLQHIVFPAHSDPDVMPLYIDVNAAEASFAAATAPADEATTHDPRRSIRVPAGQRHSFASYFNAFPASYWQRWTVVQQVRLSIETHGAGTVYVYRSNTKGVQQRVASAAVTDETLSEFDLPLTQFSDGGWYWFDLVATETDLTLRSGQWSTDAEAVRAGKLSIGMTTFNKADYCVATLRNIAENPALCNNIDQIFLVDQGTQHVRDEAGFAEIAETLGDTLQLIEQANIGGSGGFSRSMYETLQREDSDFLLLLDDDIEFETESALRALQFGRFSREPVIVGGHMFDLHAKSVLHAWAEVVHQPAFLWGPSFEEQHRHDFSTDSLKNTPWMHSRLDADYNGWWMCMIPKQVIADIGLSLPIFIKWDDAEYGLRAAAAGYRTVSLPGVALWHVSWLDKDDSQDWQAFFHTRNRIIAGLLHTDTAGGKRLLQNSGRQDIKKLLNMQYYAAQLAVDGMRSIFDGPHALHRSIQSDMPHARAHAKDFPETRVYRPGDSDTPVAARGRALPILETPEAPGGIQLALFTAKMVPQHWMTPATDATAQPELEYSKSDALWWSIPKHHSVLIGAADGSGKMWYRRDRAKFRRLLVEAQKLSRRLEAEWDQLSVQYRAALPEITSPDTWKTTFEA